MFSTTKTRTTVAMLFAALSFSALALPAAADARPISPKDRAKAEALKQNRDYCAERQERMEYYNGWSKSPKLTAEQRSENRAMANQIALNAAAYGCKWAGGTLY